MWKRASNKQQREQVVVSWQQEQKQQQQYTIAHWSRESFAWQFFFSLIAFAVCCCCCHRCRVAAATDCALVAVVFSWLAGRLGIRRAAQAALLVKRSHTFTLIFVYVFVFIPAAQLVSQSDTHPQVSSSSS